jgi:hypothetical protein
MVNDAVSFAVRVLANHPDFSHLRKQEERIAALQAENERLRSDSEKLKTLCADAQNVAIAFAKFDNGLIDTPMWVSQAVLRDAINTLTRAAKGVQP